MPKAAVSAPPGSRVSETIVTKTEKPPITLTGDQAGAVDDAADYKPETKDFWDFIATRQPADWKDLVVRFYRYPLNEKKPRELGRYLVRFDVENPLLNEAQLAKLYGGGQYDVLVQRKNRLILTAHFEIEGASRNPDAAQLGAQGVAGGGELASTLNTVLQHLQRMQTSAPAEQVPKFQETISMITALSAALPKNEGISGMVQALAALDQLRGGGAKSELKETLELLRDMGILGEGATAKKSKAEELKEILEVADLLRGSGGGGRRDWVTALVDAAPTIIEKAGGVLDKAATISQNNARIAEARRGMSVTERTIPGAPAPATQLAVMPASREVAPLEKESVAAAPAAETQAPVVIQPPTFDWVKARTVQLFQEGKPGDVVAEFLDNIDPQLGNQLASLSREQLELFISSDPILGQIAQAPRYKDFVGEIVDFFTEEAPTPA